MQYLISKANKSLLVPDSGRVQEIWPNAPKINGFAILPHDPRVTIRLRAAGIEAPAPILSHYDWAGGTPFETQKKTAALLTNNQRAYVLSDMGTGKTKAALWSWHYLYKSGVAGKLLVVAPLSTIKFVWASEVTKTIPDCTVAVLHGTRKFRRELLRDSNADIFIINHDGLKTIENELKERKDINCLIIDELAVYRNVNDRSKMMRAFAYRFVFAWGLTGRPMPNAPTDAWSQCMILTPHVVPKYFRHARSMLMMQVNPFKWTPKPEAVQKAFEWMQPSVRFSLDDVVELPEAIHRTIDCDFTPEQKRVYQKLTNDLIVMVKDKRITAANAGVAVNKLLQVCAGVVYTANPEFVTLNAEPRRDALLELIEEAPEKVIIFAPWRHLVGNLSQLLTEHKIEHAVVHGDTHHRELIFSDFQLTGKYKVLLAHPGCVHHGVTLTAATTCIWYSPTASLEVYEQANARIRRYGQKHKQQFLHLQSSQVERRMYTLLRGKQRLQDQFLSLVEEATTAGLAS